MPIRVLVTSATTVDCTKANELIRGMKAQALLADCGYDSDAIEQAQGQGLEAVIPPREQVPSATVI